MSVFEARSFKNHEMVVFCHDADSGLKAIIAIHNSSRGPALGGCRMWPYESDQEAIKDALRLSRGMTYKSAMANLPLGGGKSVIIGDAKTQKTDKLLKAMGRFVNRLHGQYIVAEDVGTTVENMDLIQTVTNHVVGTTSGGSEDPSPATAYGVLVGIQAAVTHALGKQDLKGVKVAIQGLGNVGMHLCRMLHEEGAIIWATEVSKSRTKTAKEKYNATIVGLDEIYDVDADVFVPCALGAAINDNTIPRLKVKIVAGAANNQLAHSIHGDELSKRGILYAPDYVINAGGVINVYYETQGYIKDVAYRHIAQIYDTLIEVFTKAENENISTSVAADRIAERRFSSNTSNQDDATITSYTPKAHNL